LIFGLFTFLTIFLVDLLMELVELIINKGVPFGDVTQLFIYALPTIIILVIPMALLFSVLIVFGKLSSNSEILAMQAGGIGFFRIVFPVILIGLLISVLTFFLNEKIVPIANEKRHEIFRKITFKRPLPKIAENVFFEAGENHSLYVHKFSENTGLLHKVIMFEFFNKGFPRLTVATRSEWMEKAWSFEDGLVYEFTPTGEELNEMSFAKLKFPVQTTYGDHTKHKYKRPQDMSMNELAERIEQHKKNKIPFRELEIEYFMKTSLPFASFFFVLIGAPLATRTQRGGRSIGMGLSIVIIFFYYLVMSAGKALGTGGVIPPLVAVWVQNVVIGVVGSFLLVRMSR
jgi:lipopolysaccharide export system permease protein